MKFNRSTIPNPSGQSTFCFHLLCGFVGSFVRSFVWWRSRGAGRCRLGSLRIPLCVGTVISYIEKEFWGIGAGKMGTEDELKSQGDRAEEAAPSPPPPPPPNRNPNPSSPAGPAGGYKGKSCKGCLYYSSIQKSKSQRPTCVGISRSLQQGHLFDLPSACRLFWFLCSVLACLRIWKWKRWFWKFMCALTSNHWPRCGAIIGRVDVPLIYNRYMFGVPFSQKTKKKKILCPSSCLV